jgi:hypothetical protein
MPNPSAGVEEVMYPKAPPAAHCGLEDSIGDFLRLELDSARCQLDWPADSATACGVFELVFCVELRRIELLTSSMPC